MFDHLRDPFPPEPTDADREAATDRGRRIVGWRRGRAVAGGLGALALVVAGGFALLGDGDGTTPVETEVAGTTESNPSTTTTEPPVRATTPPPDAPVPQIVPFLPAPVPSPEPPPQPPPAPLPPPPSDATLAVEVVVPAGFNITGCSVSGSPVALTGNTFTLGGLAPGSTLDVVCDAQSGDGAARAGRQVVTLQPGLNTLRLAL